MRTAVLPPPADSDLAPRPGPATRDRAPSEIAAWTQRDLRWEELLEEARRIGPDPALGELSDEQVEAAVCDLGAQLAAMTCRWLGYVAELVVRGIWADQGATTPAQWLSWKAGVATSTAREHVRVALRLRELPRIQAAFAAGRLSYSKVRALTRFAVPELEELLLRWSEAATAAELDQIAANFRTTQRHLVGDVEDTADPRYGWHQRLVGTDLVRITISLPVDEGLELRQRLERRVEVARSAPAEADEASGDAPAEADEASGDAPAEADDGSGDPPAEADDQVLHRASGGELARELLHTVLAADPDELADTSGLDRHTLVLQVSASDLQGDQPGPVPVADRAGSVRAMDRRRLRRLACEAGVVVAVTDQHGTPLDLGRRSRHPTAAIRRAVHLRDRTCTFPGCDATRHLQVHHAIHWADDGPTDLTNLVLVCAAHHRFVHDRRWAIEVRRDGQHRFVPPGRAPVPRAAPQATAARGLAHTDLGPRPTDALEPPHWAGPRTADHDLILAVLAQEFSRLAPDLVTAA